MVSEAEARRLAQAFISENIQPGIREELVISAMHAFPQAWVAVYNTKKYVETRAVRYALAGNGPLIIDRANGAIRKGVSGQPIEDQVESG